MEKEQIVFGDWKRIFMGEAPGLFLVEIGLRTAVIFVILLFALRLMGKRMSGGLTLIEMAVMLTLGGIVSIGMQTPDRGLAHGVVVLFCALLFQRGVTLLDWRHPRVEKLTQGDVSVLLKDGVLDVKELGKSGVSREQLFALLRSQGVFNLGRIKRVYLEACGDFSVFKAEPVQPGLSTLPATDREQRAQEEHPSGTLRVCVHCGRLVDPGGEKRSCPHCGFADYQLAVEA